MTTDGYSFDEDGTFSVPIDADYDSAIEHCRVRKILELLVGKIKFVF